MNAVNQVQEASAIYAVEQHALLKSFDLLATAPEGVARLRELILSLAVQGKLVPQDPKDEPASVLLERARAEKQALIKARKLKKDKPQAEIDEEEKPFALPQRWMWTRVGEISLRVQYGFTASADAETTTPKLLRITDIQNDHVNWETVPGVDASGQDLSGYYLEAGDLLIARTGGTIGKSFLVKDVPVQSVFASYLIRVSPLSNLFPSYLKTFASSPFYWKQLLAKSMGTGQPNVNGTALSALVLPLPPIQEQARIVARVDELMQLCDALEQQGKLEAVQHARLVGTLFDALANSESAHALVENWQRVAASFDLLLDRPEAVDALEQTLLQLAVRGLLVPQDPKDEPASELLKKIRQEKDHLIATGKIKRDKPLPEINEEEKQFELPEGWEWARLGTVGKNFDYGTSQKCSEIPSGVAVLRMGNIQSGQVVLSGLKYFHDQLDELPSLYLKPGDLLFNRTNSYELVGKTGIFLGAPDAFSFASYLIRIRLNANVMSAQYANLYMNTLDCRRTQIEPEIVQQNGQANFNGTKLKNICVPLPPLAEQSRIVARVAELRQLCSDLRAGLNAARSTQTRLAEAVVERAA